MTTAGHLPWACPELALSLEGPRRALKEWAWSRRNVHMRWAVTSMDGVPASVGESARSGYTVSDATGRLKQVKKNFMS